jgi:hypothetical protein
MTKLSRRSLLLLAASGIDIKGDIALERLTERALARE